MYTGLLFLLCLTAAYAARPEISLTIHRVMNEDQDLNETLHVRATEDLIILEASDVLDNNDNNSTNVNNSTAIDDEDEDEHGSRLARETNITKDDKGNIVIQLPTSDNSSTEVRVGEGEHVVNQVNDGLAIESMGGWEIHLQTGETVDIEKRHRRTEYVTRFDIYDKHSTNRSSATSSDKSSELDDLL